MATIQTKTNLWVMTKILVRCTLATIQTHPNTRLVEDARGAPTRPRSGVARPTAFPGPETMLGHLAFSMTCGVACEQRASPTLPRPQLTTLAHQNPRPSCHHAMRSQPAPAARIHVVRSYVVIKRLGARGTNSGDLMTHPNAWPHRNALLKAATPS